jgi:hypothetical protein
MNIPRTFVRMPILASVLLAACNAAPPTTGVQLEPTRTRQPESTQPVSASPRSRFTAVATPQARAMDLPSCSALSGEFRPSSMAPSADVGRVLFLDNGGDVSVIDVDGGSTQELTSDAFVERAAGRLRTYRFPVPAPDGSAVAFVRVDVDGAQVQQTVQVAELGGSGSVRDIDVVQGLNVPYVDWSADGTLLAYLAIAGADAVIRVAPAAGGDVVDVQRGAPAYWNWSPQAQKMLTHVGGRARDVEDDASVSHVQFEDGAPRVEALAVLPGQFQAPQFSPDGRHTLYAVNIGPSDLLVIGDERGMPLCVLTRLDVGAFFAWSPDGVHVAMIDVLSPAAQTAPVRVFDVRDGSSRTVHRDALMFFWSPAGDRLAVVSAAEAEVASKISAPARQQPQLLMRVEVVDVSGERTQRVADLHPTVAMVQYVQYFDQYSRAVTMWSPDGRRLTFAGAEEPNGPGSVVVAEFDEAGDLLRVQRIADGGLSLFMRR